MNNKVALTDISLSGINLNKLSLIKTLRAQHFNTKTEVCVERAKYITRYLKKRTDQNEPAELMRANAVHHYLSNREALFLDDNLLAGGTTSKSIGAPLYPELLGITIWPELETISERRINPQILTKEDADLCNFEIFPYWMDKTVFEVTRKKFNEPPSMKLMEKIVFYISGKAGAISHCVPTFETALHKGLNSIIDDAAKKEKELSESSPDVKGKEKIVFYQAIQIAMRGIINYAKSLSKKAAELAEKETDPKRIINYLKMAAVCSHVPANPARNFREAVNSLWLCFVGIHAENINMAMSPGRLDQTLYPFYEKDMKERSLSAQEALELCCCLWLKISDNTNLVPETAEKLWGGAGSTPAVTLGGVDKNGKDAVNDLTYIFLKTTELMRLRDPSVNARYHYEANDNQYRQRVADVIINTKAIPAFHNDVADIQTLVNQGLELEHARDFAIVGCVELASTGRDYVSSSSIMFNLASAMEMALLNGKRKITGEKQIGPITGDPADFTTFEEFRNAFEKQLEWLLEQAIELNEYLGKVHQEILPTPLLSAFFDGPMEKGKDLIFGGAIYNSSGGSHVAFPDVCDSLNAIEYAVFKEKWLSMKEMVEAVESNFEALDINTYNKIKNKAPKFGMEHPVALKNSKRLIEFIYSVYQKHTNYRGGPYRPAYWTMTTHAGQGKLAWALPNGRKAYEVFSSGITPASQAAQELTVAYNAVASLPGDCIPGGQALNIKYTPQGAGAGNGGYIKKFGDEMEAYFRNGGLQVQYNVQTYETLIDAKKHPDKYPEMIVRVSGYSAYFKDLSPAMKDELITRTQYNLISGKAVPLPQNWGG